MTEKHALTSRLNKARQKKPPRFRKKDHEGGVMRTKPTPAEARLIKRLGLPPDALLAVSLGLRPNFMCAHISGTWKCHSCGGKLCGQDGKQTKERS